MYIPTIHIQCQPKEMERLSLVVKMVSNRGMKRMSKNRYLERFGLLVTLRRHVRK